MTISELSSCRQFERSRQTVTDFNIALSLFAVAYINYPLRSDLMGQPSLQTFVDACHAKGIFVKLYFTTRELSNRCTEIFALKSLPHHEVLYGVDGTSGQEGGGDESGGGGAWLQVRYLYQRDMH